MWYGRDIAHAPAVVTNEQQAREREEQLTAGLEEAYVQLPAYAARAEEPAMTQERNRLAREIHDSLDHYLTIVDVQIVVANRFGSPVAEKTSSSLTRGHARP